MRKQRAKIELQLWFKLEGRLDFLALSGSQSRRTTTIISKPWRKQWENHSNIFPKKSWKFTNTKKNDTILIYL